MGQPTTRQQARNLVVAIAERDDKVDVVEKFINLTIAAAKRDLAEKVLAAVDDVWRWDDARAAVVTVFTAEGIEVEGAG